jgi:hypothetical protein
MIPIWLPSGSITLTSLALILLLILTRFDRAGRWGRLGEAMFYLLVYDFNGCLRMYALAGEIGQSAAGICGSGLQSPPGTFQNADGTSA